MALQICLLVSDDLDDHQIISEVLSTISDNIVLLNVINSQQALLLLQQGECRPDYLIIDLYMHGIKVNSILKAVRTSENGIKPSIILLGSPETSFPIENKNDFLFFDKEYDISQLKIFLSKVVRDRLSS